MIIYDDDGIGYDVVSTQSVKDAIAEIEEQRKSIHISAFVGCRIKGEYDDLYLNGKHSGLLLALDIIRKHTGVSE